MASEGTQAQVFRREGEYWTLVFASVTCRLRDTIGLHDLAYLLRRPWQEIAAADIVRARVGSPVGASPSGNTDAAVERERARVNVTRAIGGALKRITQHHPRLAAHLRSSIRTGYLCSYRPDPRLPTHWEE